MPDKNQTKSAVKKAPASKKVSTQNTATNKKVMSKKAPATTKVSSVKTAANSKANKTVNVAKKSSPKSQNSNTKVVAKKVTETAKTNNVAAPKKSSKKVESSWQGILSLVLAICAMVFFIIPYFNIALAITALVFGFMGLKNTKVWPAVTGIIIGGVMTFLSLIYILIIMAVFSFAGNAKNKMPQNEVTDFMSAQMNNVETKIDDKLVKNNNGQNSDFTNFVMTILSTENGINKSEIELKDYSVDQNGELISAVTNMGSYKGILVNDLTTKKPSAIIIIKDSEIGLDTLDFDETDAKNKIVAPTQMQMEKVEAMINNSSIMVDKNQVKIATSDFATNLAELEMKKGVVIQNSVGQYLISYENDYDMNDYTVNLIIDQAGKILGAAIELI